MTAPTIIIGLGGAGCSIATRVSRKARHLRDSSNLQFVNIDTDCNDLRQRKEDDSTIVQIQTSAPYKIEDYLEQNKAAKEQWFPNHEILMSKTPTEGAGQVRAISRLAFEEAISKGKLKALDEAVDALFPLSGDGGKQAVRVIIVSSLAGGTGSGIIIPVAMYVKHLLHSHYNKSGSVIRGFFLLPEIFEKRKSSDEVASIYANAYAATKELDAFMRKGDHVLDGTKYRNLEFPIPDLVSGKNVDYEESPFNFCFMFDKRNADDLGLNSYDDYLEYAANTIFAQAISGAASRSNSSEDNAIKTLIQSGGRNRFCGAGSALLVYPRDKIADYLAGSACFQQLGTEWLTIDREYDKHLKVIKLRRKKDPTIREEKRGEFYLKYVDSKKGEKGSFAATLYEQTHQTFFDNNTKKMNSFSKTALYLNAIMDYVKMNVISDPAIVSHMTQINAIIEEIETAGKDGLTERAQNLSERLVLLGRDISRVTATQAIKLNMALFSEDDRTESTLPYDLEFYLRDEDGKFIHPNAIRYFLYEVLGKLTDNIRELKQILEEDSKYLSLLENPFDDLETDEVETVIDRFGNRRGRIKKSKVPEMTAEAKELVEPESSKLLGWAQDSVMIEVFEEAKSYIQKISDEFENFYQVYPVFADSEKNRVDLIPHQLLNRKGSAVRYVCSSQKCLDSMVESFLSASSEGSVNGALSALIFQDIKSYALALKKPQAGNHYRKLFKEGIIGHYRDTIMDTFGPMIDLDVLSALEKEIRIEHDEEELDLREIENYMSDVLVEVNRLASTFLEEPMGPERHVIQAAAYNPGILLDDDPVRHSFVREHVNNNLGGVKDENMPKNELLVYKAVYNMNPGDFKRFRAPAKNEPGGSYYEAYMRVYRKLGPEVETNREITAHLDRHWHLPKYMPDLDDRNQKLVEDRIDRSFIWGMFSGEIEQEVDPRDPKSMRVMYSPSNSNSHKFIVSNGTFCDELYEVLDALSINPPQVEIAMDKYEKDLKKMKALNIPLGQSTLIRRLNWKDEAAALGDWFDSDYPVEGEPKFALREFIPVDSKMKPSIFDLLYWYKQSIPNTEFDLTDYKNLIDNTIHLIQDYVGNFLEGEDLYAVCLSIIKDQYELFLDNLTDPTLVRPKNRFFDKSATLIRDRIDEIVDHEYELKFRTQPSMKKIYDSKYQEVVAAA